jgi:ribosomal-protein-alanine N-acetyltransferase
MSDVPRVVEIERLAYPSTWPQAPIARVTGKSLGITFMRDKQVAEEHVCPVQEPERHRRFFPLTLLPGRSPTTVSTPSLASIIGFAGLWLMVDEAHITTIAMHPISAAVVWENLCWYVC